MNLSRINLQKLKVVLVICVVLIICLIVLTSKTKKEEEKLYHLSEQTTIDIDEYAPKVERETINYDDPSTAEREYLKRAYGDTVAFTDQGTVIYFEHAFSGKINKIITRKWPEEKIASLIPKPEFGELERIEYTEDFIRVYLNNVKSGNISSYLKELKKESFEQATNKVDTNSLLSYRFANEAGYDVSILYYKSSKKCEISLTK